MNALTALSMTGRMTAAELAKRINVPRTTAHRILDTLVAEGYVIHNEHNHCFQLSHKVRQLAQGHHRDNTLAQVARPILRSLCREVLLPVGLTAPVGHEIVLQVSLDHEAPLAHHYLPEGFAFPVTYGAVGRLFLAHCAEDARRDLIATALSSVPKYLKLYEPPTNAELDKIRDLGYAVSARPTAPEGVLAVPVYLHGKYLAGAHLRFPNHASALSEAVERYLARIQHVAHAIELALLQGVGGATTTHPA
jgi:DNA-binding IclR family transcriptional regulator